VSTLAFRPRKTRRQVHLSVTPLIDVLFLLIIFFTLTSTFKRVGELELQLPDSTTASPPAQEQEPHLVELVATEAGKLYLDDRELDLLGIRARLREIVQEDPEARVLIKAEAGVPHGEIVDLLDIVRNAGFPGVAIGTHRAAVSVETP
jgi:biopolymer transport protein ExbD